MNRSYQKWHREVDDSAHHEQRSSISSICGHSGTDTDQLQLAKALLFSNKHNVYSTISDRQLTNAASGDEIEIGWFSHLSLYLFKWGFFWVLCNYTWIYGYNFKFGLMIAKSQGLWVVTVLPHDNGCNVMTLVKTIKLQRIGYKIWCWATKLTIKLFRLLVCGHYIIHNSHELI